MSNNLILSYIYLHSILPNLEEIVEFDSNAKEITKGWNCKIQFDVSGGPKVALIFKDGKLQVKREKILFPSVAFWFPSPLSLNQMFEGKKVVPPFWGIWKISLLKKFTELTKKIEYYLKADEEFLKNKENLKFNLTLKLNTLLWGIKTVAEKDSENFKIKRALNVISRYPDSIFQLEILEGGPSAHIVISDGKFTPYKGKHPSPTAILQVKDMETARKMFDDEIDFMVALGTGDLRIIGLIPVAEAVSIIMEEMSKHLPK